VRTRLAVVLLALSSAVAAQPLGTLFHSAKERETLDRQRRGEKVEADGQAVVETREPVITGFVKRSDGKSTVFLDRRPYRTTNPAIQRSLDPRIVERYQEPGPPPPPAEPAARTRGSGAE
jgi:hypothetical protein